ncbi:hypothetical protein CGGC5_v008898 [Colletotrichum fructicola Nara gc5]|uniref:Uncharacterized protein n=1 Tax=Colletotrichum fructicola (strain Nara gc5) TaxID=1213859 RepID=A0A7J6J4L9_COLFN|nr:hypothetical protein CGGC5_v008898 [Colletotrichum fructicola Nara gc5]KAF5509027.1 hypothetical protein CGCF413_v002832 [Colletotrichum fructicola]
MASISIILSSTPLSLILLDQSGPDQRGPGTTILHTTYSYLTSPTDEADLLLLHRTTLTNLKSIVVDRRAVLPLPFPLPSVPAPFPIKQLPVLASALRTSASWWSA